MSATGEVTSQIELHDHEILRAEQALRALQDSYGRRRDLESYRREIIERFEEQGLKVLVKVWETDQDDTYWFDIQIEDRIEGEFDPDRQVHEVTNDILNLGTKGVIKTRGKASPLWVPPSARHRHHHH